MERVILTAGIMQSLKVKSRDGCVERMVPDGFSYTKVELDNNFQ